MTTGRVTLALGMVRAALIAAAPVALALLAGPAAAQMAGFVSSTTTELRAALGSPSPSVYGETVTFNATVVTNGGEAPTGTVQFFDDITQIGGDAAITTIGAGQPIAAGYTFSCAITGTGGVQCWGQNDNGRLGNDSTDPSVSPVDVSGLSGARAISTNVEAGHVCALLNTGGVKCWGYNGSGQLGDGTTTERHVPVDVSGLTNAIGISAGANHSCAVLSTGGVKCWGQAPRLGDGLGTDTTHMPVSVSGLTDAIAVAAGTSGSCALTRAGAVKCWGSELQGALGNGSSNSVKLSPVQVTGITSGAVSISLGLRTGCAVMNDGTIKCWGANDTGQVGDGDPGTDRLTPVEVLNITDAVAVSAGEIHSCALLSTGGVKCWGDNSFGTLGDNSTNFSSTPVDVSGLSNAVNVTAGNLHTCAQLSTGVLQCWGENGFNQNGTGGSRLVPTDTTAFASSGATLLLGKATVSTSALAVGSHTSITAVYSGDATNNPSTSDNLSQTVNKATPAISLNSNHNPALSGQIVTFTATVTSGATGNVAFKIDGNLIDTKALSSSAATLELSFGPSSYSITAEYQGDDTFLSRASDPLTQTANQGATTVTLMASPSGTSKVGQSVTFTASIAVTSPAVGTPTESVTFKDGATVLDTKPVSASSASLTTSTLGIGSHTITAEYSGDGNLSGSTSSGSSHTVAKGDTSAVLTSSPNGNSKIGQSVTLTATIGASSPAVGTPTGSVVFKNGGVTLDTKPLSGGVATLQTSSLSAGSHTLTAQYQSDSNFNPSTSANKSHTVAKGDTTITLTAPSISKVGQTVTLSATVVATAPAAGTTTGNVVFKDGSTTLATKPLSSGVATLQASSLAIGSHTLTAQYVGDGNFNLSTSANKSHTVAKGDTTVSLVAAPGTSKPKQSVTLTATIHVTSPAAATPSGNVTFKDGSTTLGSGAIASGAAHLATTALGIGTHSLTASFAATAQLNANTSAPASVTVSPKVGAESRVNTKTPGAQQMPAVAKLPGDAYVVVWASNAQDGSGYGIYGQRYTSSGSKSGSEFLVNTFKTGDQTAPAVGGLTNGFVVVWQSKNEDSSGQGVYGQRYTTAGAKSGAAFRVNATTANDQLAPSVAGLTGGGFVALWASNNQDNSGLGIYGQRYNVSGAKVGAEFRVNTKTAGNQSAPRITALTGGGFLAVWTSSAQDNSGLGIYGQRYTSAGAKVGSEFRVNTTTTGDQSAPAATGLKDNEFLVVWQSKNQDGSGLGIYGQRYKATGAKAGTEFLVNTVTTKDQSQPAVSGFSTGGCVVTWTSNLQDGSGQGVYAQAYNVSGVKSNVEFRINTTTAGNQQQSAVTAFAGGNFYVAWTSSDGALDGVYGQRLSFSGL